ncbi:EAL domain-containing protein [uncultured Sphingomonas sp.]|uniref:EAL domain-containing protein n=1 Tax=uncultured Sphingomonas sp. TaxID=158754 RepID=UPI0035C9546E
MSDPTLPHVRREIDRSARPIGRIGPPRWRMLAQLRIANFSLLRRHVGRARADRLTDDLAPLIRSLVPDVRVVAIARDLVEIALETDAHELIEKTLAQLGTHFASPIEIDGESHDLDILFGAAVADGSPVDDVRMVEQAEQALRQADGDRRAVVCHVDDAANAVDRIALARDLDRAIVQDELFLQYQPKMHVRRQEITSVEALVRWQHPIHGLVLPGEFIALAEQTRAITALTLWTIRQALTDQAILTREGHPLRVYVNISGFVLSDARFVAEACALLAGQAGRIGFEVTETSVIRDPEIAIANLESFAAVGVEIAIDDYGAGLSSLAYLKRLPARELKIDKLFVTQLSNSNRDPLIVRSTIDLAHALEMEVVAEGVETQAALALLSVMGCDMIQGFLICRPIGLNALIAFLENGSHSQAIENSRATFNRLAATWKYG